MKNVALSRTYTVGSSQFSELRFRDPKLLDYRQIGKPVEGQHGYVVRYPAAIWSYAERLLQETPPGALGELDLVDALAVEEQIIGFFTEAHRLLHKQQSSSSGSDGVPSTSTD